MLNDVSRVAVHCVVELMSVGLAVSLSACGQAKGTDASASSGSADPRTTAPTQAAISSGPITVCLTDDLTARMDPVGDGAGGRMANYIHFRNVGTETCRLAGYPLSVTVTEPGRPPAVAAEGSFFPVPAAKPLVPGGSAVLVVETKSNCDHEPTTDAQIHRSTYHHVKVAVQGGTFDVRAAQGLNIACGVSTSKFGGQ